ncbi:MAG: hypothetical protein JNM63_15920 [Spirochaetia bacterium]|nr:hypothetical protein [Spirochaetia bacterium]
MLDEYCRTLTDEAQVRLAIRLIRLALPIWENYLERSPGELEKIHALAGAVDPVKGASQVTASFPGTALLEVEKSLAEGKLPRENETLQGYLGTVVQPLTNPLWENTLTQSVRLVYHAVFNVLTFLGLHRSNASGETHIGVAINQACDALLREKRFTTDGLNAILLEYQNEKRKPEAAELSDGMSLEKAERIIAEMKKGLTYSREDSFASLIHYWRYVPEKQCFEYQNIDTIIGYSAGTVPHSEEEFRRILRRDFSYEGFMSETYHPEDLKT